jgi:hypothetical protein
VTFYRERGENQTRIKHPKAYGIMREHNINLPWKRRKFLEGLVERKREERVVSREKEEKISSSKPRERKDMRK